MPFTPASFEFWFQTEPIDFVAYCDAVHPQPSCNVPTYSSKESDIIAGHWDGRDYLLEQLPIPFLDIPRVWNTALDWESDTLYNEMPSVPRSLSFSETSGCSTSPSSIATAAHQSNSLLSYLLNVQFQLPSQAHLHMLLYNCSISSWLHEDAFEPKDIQNRSILFGFTTQDHPAAPFKCLFDNCEKRFDRQDRALGHIRMHIEHRPYVCGGTCKRANCNKRFSCHSYLQSHIMQELTTCCLCQKKVVKQNMSRHQKTCPGAHGCTKAKSSLKPYSKKGLFMSPKV